MNKNNDLEFDFEDLIKSEYQRWLAAHYKTTGFPIKDKEGATPVARALSQLYRAATDSGYNRWAIYAEELVLNAGFLRSEIDSDGRIARMLNEVKRNRIGVNAISLPDAAETYRGSRNSAGQNYFRRLIDKGELTFFTVNYANSPTKKTTYLDRREIEEMAK